jgi:hypothetical protein
MQAKGRAARGRRRTRQQDSVRRGQHSERTAGEGEVAQVGGGAAAAVHTLASHRAVSAVGDGYLVQAVGVVVVGVSRGGSPEAGLDWLLRLGRMGLVSQ